jgi:hypothetical protein
LLGLGEKVKDAEQEELITEQEFQHAKSLDTHKYI